MGCTASCTRPSSLSSLASPCTAFCTRPASPSHLASPSTGRSSLSPLASPCTAFGTRPASPSPLASPCTAFGARPASLSYPASRRSHVALHLMQHALSDLLGRFFLGNHVQLLRSHIGSHILDQCV